MTGNESKFFQKLGPNKNVYIWLSCLTVLLVILISLCGYICCKICNGFKVEWDGNYATLLIGVAGFLAAFSAISIYSIFNANVSQEKQMIDILKDQLKEKIEIFDKMNKDAEREKKSLKETDKKVFDILNTQNSIIQLTSPYSSTLKKREAIISFDKPDTDDNLKDMISNFYKSIESEEEKSKPYYDALGALIKKWGRD
ncbi:MAG: hypothetical protein NT166_14695 [Candidatus Aminicenantes bacterium]|nr:hypothetical protein [Candidatus Aminicenantes bacterium]